MNVVVGRRESNCAVDVTCMCGRRVVDVFMCIKRFVL